MVIAKMMGMRTTTTMMTATRREEWAELVVTGSGVRLMRWWPWMWVPCKQMQTELVASPQGLREGDGLTPGNTQGKGTGTGWWGTAA